MDLKKIFKIHFTICLRRIGLPAVMLLAPVINISAGDMPGGVYQKATPVEIPTEVSASSSVPVPQQSIDPKLPTIVVPYSFQHVHKDLERAWLRCYFLSSEDASVINNLIGIAATFIEIHGKDVSGKAELIVKNYPGKDLSKARSYKCEFSLLESGNDKVSVFTKKVTQYSWLEPAWAGALPESTLVVYGLLNQ